MNALVKPVVVLTLICVVTSALLGMTYDVTAPLIEKAKKAASDAAMVEVLPSAAGFDEMTVEGVEGILLAAKDKGGSGTVFKVKDKGFGGAYVVMVGIGSDGKLTGTKLLDNTETPGLGSKTGLPAFMDQFVGKDGAMDGVSTIAGATISSKAFMRCIDTAYKAYAVVGEGK